MEELLGVFGIGTACAIVGYLIRLLIEQKLRKELEDHKHALTVLGKRLDFLHQERGKAALSLVRLMKTAKMHVKLLVDPMQLGPVDPEQACKDSHEAYTELHNQIADSSFLFPKPLADHMLKTRQTLWRILSKATLRLQEAKRKGTSPFDDGSFRDIWKKLPEEFEPLETAMIEEIRTLLDATEDDDHSTARDAASPHS